MGCGQAKETRKAFEQQVAKLENKVQKLFLVKDQMEKVILDVCEGVQESPGFKPKTELTQRLEKLQDMIREIQNFHVTTRYSYTNPIIVQQNESFPSSDDEGLESSRANLAMIKGKPVIDDPSIKAIIDKKRRVLESKNRKKLESEIYQLNETQIRLGEYNG